MEFDQDIINGTTNPAWRGIQYSTAACSNWEKNKPFHIYVPTNQELFHELVPIVRNFLLGIKDLAVKIEGSFEYLWL
jgi:hypothetical protein